MEKVDGGDELQLPMNQSIANRCSESNGIAFC